jgi:hypothetical protein
MTADIVTFDTSDLETGKAQLTRYFEGTLRRRVWIGGAYIGDDGCACGAAHRQQGAHAPVEQRIVTFARIGHTVAMCEGDRALAEAFQYEYVEITTLDQIDRRFEAVGGKSGAGADAENLRRHRRFPRSIALERSDFREE